MDEMDQNIKIYEDEVPAPEEVILPLEGEAQMGESEVNVDECVKKRGRKKILIVGISIVALASIALVLFLLLRHKHTWIPATCLKFSYCSECGEQSGGYADHEYNFGQCVVCNYLSNEAETELSDTVKNVYGIYWIVTFDKYIELDHISNMTVEFSQVSISTGKGLVKGQIIAKAKNGNYYLDNFSFGVVYSDGDWIRDSSVDTQFNTQPIECFENGYDKYFNYTKNPTYIYNTYNGKEKSTMKFTDSTCTVTIYDYYGRVTSSATFEYAITHGVAWDYVILFGENGNIELVKMENGLIWDDMVFLLS